MTGAADIFAAAGPRWYSIPSGRAFLDDLASGLMQALGGALSEAQLLTPTRRGARAMARAFSVRSRGGALLLPQIRAIGDLDEGEPPFDLEALGLDLPPALSPLRRRFELARLISAHADLFARTAMTTRRALDLADSLGAFFDSLALEEIDAVDRLDRLIAGEGEDEYVLAAWAEHWQVSARFLGLAVRAWPERLAELGFMDPNQRQVALIRRLAGQWEAHPPAAPLLLAGSTGSAPAMADLMRVVAEAPRGAVVLPGLDLSLADDAWAQIEESHPQFTMKHLLDRHRLTRAAVREWPVSVDPDRKARSRRRLLNEALRPAEATKDWRAQIARLREETPDNDPITDGLSGLHRVEAARDEEAASVIALLMREVLDTPNRVAALVTPDQTLARRVSARLTRWGLQADSSAGEPLANTPAGRLLLDLLGLMLDPADPVLVLSLLNNPLCRFNDHRGMRALEMRGLRGARPRDADAVLARIEGRDDAIRLWTDYCEIMAPLAVPSATLTAALTAVTVAAEALSPDGALWSGAPGAQAAELLAGMIAESTDFAVEGPAEVADILGQAIGLCKVRTGGNTHPRLLILGAIEARLVQADRVILAGLEEGVWPQSPPLDPFLSRPMRKRLGLPSPERRTGLSAHDFLQAASGPEAFLVTRKRREGEPQVASRWLWRLQTLCEGARVPVPGADDYLRWACTLDTGLEIKPAFLRPAPRPEPKPPVTVRPDRMSVTEVETFIRDPYAVYARRVLRLEPVDRPNEPVEALQRGTAIHAALEAYTRDIVPGSADPGRLTALLEAELGGAGLPPADLALYRPLLGDLAQGFATFDAGRRADRPALYLEQRGELKIATTRGDFTLIARADRIERRDGGRVDVLDYKTGAPPKPDAVAKGFYPQLTLTAAMLKRGAFDGIRAQDTGDLIYVRVAASGVKAASVVRDIPADGLAEQAFARLKVRLDAYANASKGYLSWAAPQYAGNRGGNYDQLARLYEWDVLGGEDDGDEAP